MNFNSAGILEGIKKAGKVALYVATSGAITALIAELAKYDVSKEEVWVVALVMVANAILAGASKWLSTKK